MVVQTQLHFTWRSIMVFIAILQLLPERHLHGQQVPEQLIQSVAITIISLVAEMVVRTQLHFTWRLIMVFIPIPQLLLAHHLRGQQAPEQLIQPAAITIISLVAEMVAQTQLYFTWRSITVYILTPQSLPADRSAGQPAPEQPTQPAVTIITLRQGLMVVQIQ